MHFQIICFYTRREQLNTYQARSDSYNMHSEVLEYDK